MQRTASSASRRSAAPTTRAPLLTDAGPLIALAWPRDVHHRRCMEAYFKLRRRMTTTWAAFTEAMYLLDSRAGWPGLDRLWRFVGSGELTFSEVAQPYRAAELMARYRDMPMDLGDATLVAVAEQDDHRQIFTVDSDFYAYRLANGLALEVIP